VAATSSPQDQEIIKLLESLKSVDAEYPPELLVARRGAFIESVARRRQAGVREAVSPQDQEIIQLLETLRTEGAEYPSELLAARRAAFIQQVRQRDGVEEALPSQGQEIIAILQSFESVKAEYPPELLTARRAAFMRQVAQRSPVAVQEEMPAQGQAISTGFERLKSVETGYPPDLWAARRAAFIGQVVREHRVSLLDALRSAIQSWFSYKAKAPLIPMRVMRTSLIVAGMLVATFVGSLVYGYRDQLGELTNLSAPQEEFPGPIPASATSTHELAEIVCKPGYSPPLCLAKEFDKRQDLTFQGNGARAAVAKDTLPGEIHRAGYANDGFYGPGSSWVSNTAYSWLKIDLGKATTINTVTFGRDRLGHNKEHDPGQFVIAVAMFDNVYADGNSSNDSLEYIQVYNSRSDGFTGIVSGPETVKAAFEPVLARFVKITFTNSGTAIDEVEAFMVQPPLGVEDNSTRRDGDSRRPTNTPIPLPTNTPLPTDTSIPVPTNTPLPTNTSTPVPTDTPLPTDTPIPAPTDTPIPVPTDTPIPLPTDPPPPDAISTDIPPDILLPTVEPEALP